MAATLKPPPRGWLRGRVANIRRSMQLSAYGESMVIEFDLVIDSDRPPVPVRMEGSGMTGHISETALADVPDPDPAQRPIRATTLRYPGDPLHRVAMYDPQEGVRPRAAARNFSLLMVVGPLLVLLALYGLYLALTQ